MHSVRINCYAINKVYFIMEKNDMYANDSFYFFSSQLQFYVIQVLVFIPYL